MLYIRYVTKHLFVSVENDHSKLLDYPEFYLDFQSMQLLSTLYVNITSVGKKKKLTDVSFTDHFL